MRVAIAQIDGKWPNLALAKIAAWHRSNGDDVTRFMALMSDYDVVYASKVFDFTPDDPYLPEHAIKGGSGYGVARPVCLADEFERMKPDWSLWPEWTTDLGYSTRGCPSECPWCVVPRNEGPLRVVADFASLTTGRSDLVLLDGNVTAAPIEHFRALCGDATSAGVRLDFSQGLDARLITDEHAAIIAKSRMTRRLHLAFDRPHDEDAVRRAVSILSDAGVHPSRLTFYVLIGYGTTQEEDMHRVELLRSLGCDPFVMKFNKIDRYQTRFARWVNNKVAFKAMTWQEWNARFKTNPCRMVEG